MSRVVVRWTTIIAAVFSELLSFFIALFLTAYLAETEIFMEIRKPAFPVSIRGINSWISAAGACTALHRHCPLSEGHLQA